MSEVRVSLVKNGDHDMNLADGDHTEVIIEDTLLDDHGSRVFSKE